MQISNSGQSVPEGNPYARHLPALDGVRGFAVLGVACSHIFPGNPHSHLEFLVHNAFAFGSSGVDLFFVLSGFLITGILYDSLPDPGFFRKFYARRILRIFPLYYGVLLVYALAALLFGLNFHHELASLALYLQNTTLIAQRIHDYRGPTALPLSHFWSLAIEEQFYFVWPLTVFFLRKRRRLLIFCAAALVLCPLLRVFLFVHHFNYAVVVENTVCRSDSLLAGAALALLFRSRFHDLVFRAGAWIFLAGAVFGDLILSFAFSGPLLNSPTGYQIYLAYSFSAVAMVSVGFVILSLQSALVSRICTLYPFRWLGKYSYGIYVLHLILFTYLDEPFRNFLSAHLTPSKGVDIGITGMLVFLISLLAAYLSYNLFEKRFLRLKRFFDYRPHPNTAS